MPVRNPGRRPGLSLMTVQGAAENGARRRGALVALGFACVLALLIAATWPGEADSAPARVVVLGKTDQTPPPSCPGKIVNNVEVVPCRVEGHVSGFQAIAGGVPRPYEVPFDGKIVAWSITLARPSHSEGEKVTDEIGFFDEFLGKPSEARIGVLKPVEGSNPPQFKLVRQSPLEVLNPYFGSTVVFALDHPLNVVQGQVVALTVPTWAPMFAFGISSENTWRGSRLPKHCSSKQDIQDGHPQQGVGKTKTYGCYYSEARLLYTATVVKKP